MSVIPRSGQGQEPFPLEGRGFASWRQFWPPAALSLALSLGILAVVLFMAYRGNQAEAHPLAQPPFDLIINRGEGDCPLCLQSDPNYDPEMGFFNLGCSSCPINDTAYVWNRTPFYADPHSLGSPAYNSFYFWLHRNKGCGDFSMWGTSDQITITRIVPFSIPCTGALAGDTIRASFDATVPTFLSPGKVGYNLPTLFAQTGMPVDLTDEVDNLTDTWVEGGLDLGGGADLWGDAGFTVWFKSLPGKGGEVGAQESSSAKTIPPRGKATFTVTIQPNWSQVTQTVGAASTPRVTGTLVFSFGPTARISQTLVVAQPYLAFVPLATRDWGAGW